MAYPYFAIALIILYFWGVTDVFFDPMYILIILIFHFFLSLPALFLHINYFSNNRGFEIEIDKSLDEISINKKGEIYKYRISDLVVIRKMNRDFHYPKWQQNWFLAPWLYYGYIQITAPNKKVYYMTSLMIDIQSPPINYNDTEYSSFPFIGKSVESIEYEKESLIKYFKTNFKDYTTGQLEEIINGDSYQEEAIIAAKELLINYNTATNKRAAPSPEPLKFARSGGQLNEK